MTTDRPAAPTRGTALADACPPAAVPRPHRRMLSPRCSAPWRRSARPARRDERPVHRDDTPRWDDGRATSSAVRSSPSTTSTAAPSTHAKDLPATGSDTSCEPEAPEDAPVTPTTPSLFALQLASPLPPATPAPAPATAPAPAVPTTTVPQGAPVLPVLSSIVPPPWSPPRRPRP